MADPAVDRADITGLVLAGGQGSRLGGVDKGLQPYRGEPLALSAMRRITPQVSRVMLSANRHLDDYGSWGVPV
ncbi:MAG TPA: NTP transferase domain-containing protein, partial [Rhizobacter sp.]